MKKTVDYLGEAKEKTGIKSDNAFALSIGISRQNLSQLKKGERVMEDYCCIKLAEILKINPMEVIAAANYEREKSEEKREFWLNFMKQYARSTAAMALLQCIILMSCLSYSDPAQAIDLQRFSMRENVQSITIIRNFIIDKNLVNPPLTR